MMHIHGPDACGHEWIAGPLYCTKCDPLTLRPGVNTVCVGLEGEYREATIQIAEDCRVLTLEDYNGVFWRGHIFEWDIEPAEPLNIWTHGAYERNALLTQNLRYRA